MSVKNSVVYTSEQAIEIARELLGRTDAVFRHRERPRAFTLPMPYRDRCSEMRLPAHVYFTHPPGQPRCPSQRGDGIAALENKRPVVGLGLKGKLRDIEHSMLTYKAEGTV